MEDVLIIIDTREPKTFAEILTEKGVEHEVSCLDCGDFLIASGTRQIAIERKTRRDLCSSIRDGRYYSQKSRMVSFAESAAKETLCIVLVEDDYGMPLTTKERAMVNGAIASMTASGFFSVLSSSGPEETAMFVTKIAKKIVDEFTVREKTMRRKPKLAAANRLSTGNPFSNVPGIGAKSIAEITRCLAGEPFSAVLAMSRDDLIARGISKRTATAIVKAAAVKI